MRSRFKEYIQTENLQLNESLVGKGFAIGQRSRFLSNKTKLQSKLSQLKNTVKSGLDSDDPEKRLKVARETFLLLADAMQIQSEMSTQIMNITVSLSLFQEKLNK